MSKKKHKKRPTLGKGLTVAKVVELRESMDTVVIDPLADTKIIDLEPPEVVTLESDIQAGGGAWG